MRLGLLEVSALAFGCVAREKDGSRLLMAGGTDCTVLTYLVSRSYSHGRESYTLEPLVGVSYAHDAKVTALCFCDDSLFASISSEDCNLKLVDVERCTTRTEWLTHTLA